MCFPFPHYSNSNKNEVKFGLDFEELKGWNTRNQYFRGILEIQAYTTLITNHLAVVCSTTIFISICRIDFSYRLTSETPVSHSGFHNLKTFCLKTDVPDNVPDTSARIFLSKCNFQCWQRFSYCHTSCLAPDKVGRIWTRQMCWWEAVRCMKKTDFL